MRKSDQTYFKNQTARFVKFVLPFFNIMHEWLTFVVTLVLNGIRYNGI